VDVVVGNDLATMHRRRFIYQVCRMIVVAPPRIPIRGTAVDVIDAPAPADVDAVIRRIRDLVVRNLLSKTCKA
jgi:hypothetical protein